MSVEELTLESLIEKKRWLYKDFYIKVGMTEDTFIRRRKKPGEFKISEIVKIAEVLGIDDRKVYDILRKEASKQIKPE